MPANRVSEYAAIHARVRVMYADILSAAALDAFHEAPDLVALVRSLKETAYGPYLSQTDDKPLTSRRIGYQIRRRLADNYLGLIQAVPVQARPLLAQLFRRFEVDNLKAVLRGIISGSSWEQVRFVLFPLNSFTVLPAQQMVEAGSIETAVELLSSTPYHRTLSHALKRYSEERSVFPLEVSLDLSYWRELWKEVNRLPGQDREQALKIIGALVDMTNLMWAIRYRVYHHLAEEVVINYTLSFGYRLRDTDIRSVAAGANIAEVVARRYPGLTGTEYLLQEPHSGLPQLELQLQRLLADQCRAAFIGFPFHIGLPLAYLILSELEIQDLTVLIEAKSAKMSLSDFRPYLLNRKAARENAN